MTAVNRLGELTLPDAITSIEHLADRRSNPAPVYNPACQTRREKPVGSAPSAATHSMTTSETAFADIGAEAMRFRRSIGPARTDAQV